MGSLRVCISCSIFNLIPACKFCNQLKREDFSGGQLIYPFEEEFGEIKEIHTTTMSNNFNIWFKKDGE